MSSPEGSGLAGPRRWSGPALAALIGVVGVVMMHHPMIFSGFGRVQVDLADTRLINYFLEHNYLWYLGAEGHRSFWDPPFFYPARNIMAYSDTMLGVAPLYAPFRLLGFAPDTSYQLWMIALSGLNYSVMLHLLARRLGLSWFAAAIGAFLFAFGSPRANMMAQQTQMTQFLSLIGIDALFGIFGGRYASRLARASAWIVAAFAMLAQLSSAFYPGFFTVLGAGTVGALALAVPSTRGPFLRAIRRDWPWIALASALAGLAARPWLLHHLAAARLLGPRWLPFAHSAMPRPWTWIETGPRNWVGQGVARLLGFELPEPIGLTTPLGLGLITTLLVGLGLAWSWGRGSTRIVATGGLLLGLWLTLTPAWLLLGLKFGLILGSLSGGFQARREHPRAFLAVVGLVLALQVFNRSGGDLPLGFGLLGLGVATSALAGWSGRVEHAAVLGLIVLGLAWSLFWAPLVWGLGLAVGLGSGAVVRVLGYRSTRAIGGAIALGFLGFAVPITYGGRPGVCLIGLAAVPLMLVRTRGVAPPGWLPWVALAGVAMQLMYQGDSAWEFFYIHVPGASSLIFLSRVGLVVLIPASIGLGHAIDGLRARGRGRLDLALGLACCLEQGTTTPSFDKAANRDVIAALAGRVDDHSEAFFATPSIERTPVQNNLDAMWAGLARSRPTVNGYSGHTPKDWREVDEPSGFRDRDLRRLDRAWGRWMDKVGRTLAGVQWIGGPGDRAGGYPRGGPEDDLPIGILEPEEPLRAFPEPRRRRGQQDR